MADYQKDELDKTGAGAAKVHKIRITLTSRNVKPLEKCESRAVDELAGRSGRKARWTLAHCAWTLVGLGLQVQGG